ncbi:hypothetical protein HAZT_HAZT009240 [Hyalella azteca]|uniref:YqaJ viral recombinase domain-containing protein n=1 Tax=Hyalella azteca TaxID=294128 RepID=A0A6A0H9M0_HYAAZ|nr:hypothetical protein HAZT_HAZT009240 [Hyalella azteca]
MADETSMRPNEKLLKPWVVTDADGTIISAHYDSVAGVGETCTHVGAVLFKVDAIVRCREKTTVTAYWMVPSSIAKVEPQVGYRIDYTPSTAKKRALDRVLDGSQPGAMPVMEIRTGPATKTVFQALDADELKMMLEELHLTGVEAAVLSVTPEYSVVYGKQMENEALASYKASVKDDHFEFMMEKSGLVVNPEIPFMAASPDSIVTCDCCGRGVVEVKCLYTHRESTLEEAIEEDVDDMVACDNEKCETEYFIFGVLAEIHHRTRMTVGFLTSSLLSP